LSERGPGAGEPVYLTLDDVLELYGFVIAGTATDAARQLRDRDRLEAALARPATYAHYENADLALQAAVLAHGIAESQAFVDGNKRAALVAMLTFLEINGVVISRPDPELADWIISLGAGTTPGELAERIRPARISAE